MSPPRRRIVRNPGRAVPTAEVTVTGGNVLGARTDLSITKDFADYQDKLRPDFDYEVRPVKTVVVSQDPRSGQTVPHGTEVKVVMAAKPSLPVDIFDLDDLVAEKYAEKNVGIVIQDLEEKGPAAKAILDQDKEYVDLKTDEKRAVREYARKELQFTGDEEALIPVYDDLKFLINF
jgi:hypothetical protein